VAGGCGYLVVTFWTAPILCYLQIRHEVTSDLIFYANVIDPSVLNNRLKERHEAAVEAFRRQAAEIAASYYRLPGWYRFLLKRRGEDPVIASRNLIGLSNCAKETDAHPHIRWVMKSLKITSELDL